MSITHHFSFPRTAMATLLATTLTAGISGCSSESSSTTSSTTIDGSVFASSVNGASCEIHNAAGNLIRASFSTSATGNFSVEIADNKLTDDLVLVCNGGTYTDEADGTTQTAGTMAAYAAGATIGADTSFNATPGSTIVYQLMNQHGMTLVQAQAAFELAFGYVPDVTVAPTDANNPASGTNLATLTAGLRAAAFSQMTSDLGMTQDQQFDLLAALVQDLSDGMANGANGSGPVTIAGSAINLPVAVLDEFTASMNNFRTERIARTSSYQLEYLPSMMTTQGKTQFSISITNPVGGLPMEGEMVALMPMMYMDGYAHSTPVDGSCLENASGVYDCTMYYVMASEMNGISMGIWDLKVMVGGMMGEVAHFYPRVTMAMGGTAMAKLKNSADTMTDMEGTATARTYQVFKSSLTGMTGNHTFELYTTTMETMMDFPAVYPGITLNQGSMSEQTINSMSMEVSTTTTFDTVYTASNDGNGYWTAAGIDGLTDGNEGTLYVRMTINGLVYNSSIDGVLIEGVNEYAIFTVTPASMPMPM